MKSAIKLRNENSVLLSSFISFYYSCYKLERKLLFKLRKVPKLLYRLRKGKNPSNENGVQRAAQRKALLLRQQNIFEPSPNSVS